MKPSLACHCEELDSAGVMTLYQESKYVIEGQYFMTLSKNKEVEKVMSHEGVGTEILYKITRSHKGLDTSKVAALVQMSGDCSTNFKRGKKYLIFGDDVRFLEMKGSQIPLAPPFKTQGVVSIEVAKKELEYWNEKSKEYQIIFTNSCLSWDLSSPYGQFIKSIIK